MKDFLLLKVWTFFPPPGQEILNQIMANTPHNWSPNTLANFSQSLAEFFQAQPQHRDDKNTLKRNVEATYKKWKVSHYSYWSIVCKDYYSHFYM